MNGDPGNLEARVPRDTYRAQFCGIESGFHFVQGKGYRPTDGCFGRPAQTVARIRTYQPHKVPPRISDTQIQCGGDSISGRRPRLVKLFSHEVEAIGQQAVCAQKYRMLFHACGFLTADVYVERAGSTRDSVAAADGLMEERSWPSTRLDFDSLTFVLLGPSPEWPAASG